MILNRTIQIFLLNLRKVVFSVMLTFFLASNCIGQKIGKNQTSISISDTTFFFNKKLFYLFDIVLPRRNLANSITKALPKVKFFHYIMFTSDYLYISKENSKVKSSIIFEGLNQSKIDDWEIAILGFESFQMSIGFKPVFCDEKTIVFNVYSASKKRSKKRGYAYSHSVVYLIKEIY